MSGEQSAEPSRPVAFPEWPTGAPRIATGMITADEIKASSITTERMALPRESYDPGDVARLMLAPPPRPAPEYRKYSDPALGDSLAYEMLVVVFGLSVASVVFGLALMLQG